MSSRIEAPGSVDDLVALYEAVGEVSSRLWEVIIRLTTSRYDDRGSAGIYYFTVGRILVR